MDCVEAELCGRVLCLLSKYQQEEERGCRDDLVKFFLWWHNVFGVW